MKSIAVIVAALVALWVGVRVLWPLGSLAISYLAFVPVLHKVSPFRAFGVDERKGGPDALQSAIALATRGLTREQKFDRLKAAGFRCDDYRCGYRDRPAWFGDRFVQAEVLRDEASSVAIRFHKG